MANSRVYASAIVAGAVCGLRSFSGPAVFSIAARRGAVSADRQPFKTLASGGGLVTIVALAIGEAIADKLPSTPKRTDPGPLAARALTGAVSASAVCAATGRCLAAGALLGSIAAVLSARAAYGARRRIVKATNLPDAAIALAEDCLAYGGGIAGVHLAR